MLNHVDQETRTFVLQCSILRSMNENLVKQVTGLASSRRKLEELEKQGLFIQQMDSEDNWWRFSSVVLPLSFLIAAKLN